MVSVMSVLGGVEIGILTFELLLNLLTYLLILVHGSVFLIILDSISLKMKGECRKIRTELKKPNCNHGIFLHNK